MLPHVNESEMKIQMIGSHMQKGKRQGKEAELKTSFLWQ